MFDSILGIHVLHFHYFMETLTKHYNKQYYNNEIVVRFYSC